MTNSNTLAPRWLKVSYSLLVAILIPVYWHQYTPQNFLWLSDVGLFLTLFGLWFNSPLLMSICALSILPLELFWDIDFGVELLTGHTTIGLAHYMFESNYALFVRSLSLFHIVMQAIWIWALSKWGYDKRALTYGTAVVLTVLTLTYLLTDPDKGINGVALPQFAGWDWMPPLLWLTIYMATLPLLIYWPWHRLLSKLCKGAG